MNKNVLINNNYLVNDIQSIKSFSNEYFINSINSFVKDNENKYQCMYLTTKGFSKVYFLNKRIVNKNKNVLLIIHELSRTGAPMVVLDSARVFLKNGYNVSVITPTEGPLMYDILDSGVPVIVMPELKHLMYTTSETNNFLNVMDIDCFVNGYENVVFVTACLYNFVRRFFNTNKTIFWWIHEGNEAYKILEYKMPKVVSNNIKVLCGGSYSLECLNDWCFRYHPQVLNYGIKDEYDAKKKIKHDKITFLLAGSICQRKGQKVLLDAIRELNVDYLNRTKFIFVGDPYPNDVAGQLLFQELKEYANTHDNVVVYGNMKREELYKLYYSIDVLVLASIDDPMPVVATENFMLNNICLASDKTGTAYYIEDGVNGFVFESNNKDMLKESIMKIVDHKDLETIKKNGRKIFDDYFHENVFENNLVSTIGRLNNE